MARKGKRLAKRPVFYGFDVSNSSPAVAYCKVRREADGSITVLEAWQEQASSPTPMKDQG